MEWLLSITEYPFMVLSLTFIICYFYYYIIYGVKRPLFVCREGPWRDFLQNNLTILQESYWPTPWCLDGRLQTVVGNAIRLVWRNIKYEREILDLKDGGIISLDWVSKPKRQDQPIVILLPGLGGCSQSEYIKGFVVHLKDSDVCCVVFNHRGMGNTELKTSKTYCGANSDDIEEAIEHIHSLYPQSPLVALGISLGGMIIGNYLVTRGEKAAQYLTAVLVMSIPWNLLSCTESIETPVLNFLINYTITTHMCRIFKKFKSRLDGDYPWNFSHLLKSKTIREFDSKFTAIRFGFRDVDEYYQAASLDDKLERMRVPFLCLTAADDLFQPMKGIPMTKIKESSHVAIVVTSRGGHVSFMEGLFPIKTYYSDRLYGQFVKSVFSNLDLIRNIKLEGDKYAHNLT